jgi:hypothetical protein
MRKTKNSFIAQARVVPFSRETVVASRFTAGSSDIELRAAKKYFRPIKNSGEITRVIEFLVN